MNLKNDENDHLAILIVEQDSQLLSMLEMLFSAGGYEVFCTDNGQAALDQAAKFRYPLVITGLDLLEMDGVDLLAGLTEIDPFIECIVLAEMSELSRVIEASEVGNVFNHFWKPLQDMGELIRTVARALERRELRLNNAHLLTELRDSREAQRKHFTHLVQLNKISVLGHLKSQLSGSIENPPEKLGDNGRDTRKALKSSETETNFADKTNLVLEYNGEIENEVQKGIDVLEHLIDYAIDQDDAPSIIKIDDVLNESLDLLRPLLDAKSIQITLDLSADTPYLFVSRPKLCQILTGIILNSQQAIDETGGVISVCTSITEIAASHETMVQVSIKDNGCGISEESLLHVFDPFFSTYNREDNFGIGLTIARRTLRDWDGDIEIQSKNRNGTEVILSLPVRSADISLQQCSSAIDDKALESSDSEQHAA